MHGDDCVALNAKPETERNRRCHSLCARRADLAAMPGVPHPIPSRTRKLSPPGPMVLCPKAWESRSLPGLPGARREKSPTLIRYDGFGRDVLGRDFRGRLHIWTMV